MFGHLSNINFRNAAGTALPMHFPTSPDPGGLHRLALHTVSELKRKANL